MSIEEAYKYLKNQSLLSYPSPEAENIASIIFEDKYHIKNTSSTLDFKYSNELKSICERIQSNEPVQYITGIAHFFGYKFKVNPHVLIPRFETEELVDWVIKDHKHSKSQADVLDIGTGSGCICISLKKKIPFFRMFGIEYSIDALNVSRINAKNLQSAVEFYRINFLDQNQWDYLGQFDLIISNPPYIAQGERSLMHENVLRYEPEMALFAESEDPILFYRKIHDFAIEHLKIGGRMYLELNEYLVKEIVSIFENSPRTIKLEIRADMQGKERMLKVQF